LEVTLTTMRFTQIALLLISLASSAHGELTAKFVSGGKTITQTVALPSLYVAEGESPASGLVPGPFVATYTGSLTIPKRYRVFFSIESKGEVLLKVNGTEVAFTDGKSERLRLNPGETAIELTFTSPGNGAGSFLLFWEERREFPREPIPASAFNSTDKAPPIDAAHLFASQNCLQCHTADLGNTAMPELKYAGPNLTGIGSRANEAWITRWIAQPDLLKPTTVMPAMVDHTKPEGAQGAADIGAYLASLTSDKPATKAPDISLAQRGGEHFHNLGCIACHSKPEANQPDYENGRIPLNNVATKFKDGSLIVFLKNPQEHHEAIKMPNFRFSDEEASSLAAYLTKTSTGEHTPDPSEFPPGDSLRGKSLVESLNCSACHEGLAPSKTKAPSLAELKDWTAGCLGPDEKRGKSPRLILTDNEKKALTPAVLPSLKFDTVEAYTSRQIEALNCTSCHNYNGKSALLSSTHGETKSLLDHITEADERLIQSRPPLTHMGAMLHTGYIEKMLLGTAEPRPRPWLEMRMPAFPLHAKHMAEGLGQHHGLAASKPSSEKPDADQVKLGENLVGMTGYACVTCHAINDKKALAAFEVQGINFGLTYNRLRPDFYHQWMFNPARLVPDTKMPRYTNPDDGTGLRPDILDGDSKKQFEAIWQYFQSVKK